MNDPSEISPGRRLRSYAAVALGGLVVVMIVANHVIRGRSLTLLDVVFYIVILAVALLVFDKEVFLMATREGRKFTPWAKATQVGVRIPQDLPPPPPPKSP